MKRVRTNRVSVTLDPGMRVALEVRAGKSGLPIAAEAMVALRQALWPTINSEAVQLRIKQDAAFRTRAQWLDDQATETYVANAVRAAEGDANDAPPAY